MTTITSINSRNEIKIFTNTLMYIFYLIVHVSILQQKHKLELPDRAQLHNVVCTRRLIAELRAKYKGSIL